MMDWFNDDLSDYINKKEKVLIDVRKNNSLCWFMTVLDSLLGAVFVGALGFYFDAAMAVFAFLGSFVLFMILVYNIQCATRYVLTNCGIYKISGLIFKRVKFVAYNQVTDASMYRGPIQQMCGAGSVSVGTASGNVVGSVFDGNGATLSVPELTISSVNEYKKIREIIIKNRKK